MAEEKLNQNEIDALVAKVRGITPPVPAIEENEQFLKLGITEKDLNGLNKLFRISIEASTEVLKSVTQKDVKVESIDVIKIAGGEELSKLINSPYLATKVDYVKGLRGLDILLIKQSDMNNLMKLQFESMGYEIEDLDTEMTISASNEIMNQMMGNASNKLGTELGIFIDISTPETIIREDDDSVIPFLKEDSLSYVYTTFKLNIDGEVTGDLIKVLDADFLEELRDIMHGEDESEVNEEKETDQNETEHKSDKEVPNIAQPIDEKQEVSLYDLPNLYSTNNNCCESQASMKRVKNVEIEMTVELGRTKMSVQDILKLDKGSIVEINRLAGEHVDLLANGELIAKGEIVVIKDNFGLRILSIVDTADR